MILHVCVCFVCVCVSAQGTRHPAHQPVDLWSTGWYVHNQGVKTHRMTKNEYLSMSWVTSKREEELKARPKALDPRKKVAVRLEQKVCVPHSRAHTRRFMRASAVSEYV